MTEVGIISLVVLAFIAGAIVGVILISMCMSNERYDDSEAMYDLGYGRGWDEAKKDTQKNLEAICSHCGQRGF